VAATSGCLFRGNSTSRRGCGAEGPPSDGITRFRREGSVLVAVTSKIELKVQDVPPDVDRSREVETAGVCPAVQGGARDDVVRIAVALERGSRPACGWVEDSEGRRTAFAGMLELICLLDVAMATPGPSSGSRGAPGALAAAVRSA
jgi:hypothetical protein